MTKEELYNDAKYIAAEHLSCFCEDYGYREGCTLAEDLQALILKYCEEE